MADSAPEISKEELQKEIAEILDNASLDKISTKKVIQKLESKLGVDLLEKKTMIDQMVMDYVNNMDSDEGESMDEEEEPPKVTKKSKSKKQDNDDDDDEENDDSNDSDWGCGRERHLYLNGCSDKNYRSLQQEPTITTSVRRLPNPTSKAVILKRVNPHKEEDEADIFGKLTAKKLKRLPEEKRDSMMIQINQLLYDSIYPRPGIGNGSQGYFSAASNISVNGPILARKIYRVNAIPNNLKVDNIPNAAPLISLAKIPKPSTTLSNEVQETNASNNTGYKCAII